MPEAKSIFLPFSPLGSLPLFILKNTGMKVVLSFKKCVNLIEQLGFKHGEQLGKK